MSMGKNKIVGMEQFGSMAKGSKVKTAKIVDVAWNTIDLNEFMIPIKGGLSVVESEQKDVKRSE